MMVMTMKIAIIFFMSMISLAVKKEAISMEILFPPPLYLVASFLADSSRNRYLILDVLGQGTFGQVVKCQNLKTQEVVAVKVVKNKTAYFNQSMMEVSVLDLVCAAQSMCACLY
jgi:hypothetical protein